MDWSDEKFNVFPSTSSCVTESAVMLCDDHKCPQEFWSCGDGQCIPYFNRYIYQTIYPSDRSCFSGREYNYMCELAANVSLWTKPDGLCAESGYNDSSLVFSSNNDDDQCIYLIRCALSKGAEINCPCKGIDCNALMTNSCVPRGAYLYPSRGIIRPWFVQMYTWEQNWNDKMPYINVIIGSFRCRGFAVIVPDQLRQQYKFSVRTGNFMNFDLEKVLCSLIAMQHKNFTSSHKYSSTCWNDSLTFNERPYAFIDICPDSGVCFSQYRITDGYWDCLDQKDEFENTDHENRNYCENIRKYRFQCSSTQITCLPITNFLLSIQSNGICQNKHDNMINGTGRYLATISCSSINTDLNECDLLRHYIGNSSMLNSTFIDSSHTNEDSSLKRLSIETPFAYYCDTFWDKQPSHIDENPDFCSVWICAKDQFRCRTGQCISMDWVCDGEWDCSDASDEFNLPDHNLDKRKETCQQKYTTSLPFQNICHFDYEYPCFRASVSDPLDIITHRPCINYSQIGNGIADCYGGVDEKNTFEDCQKNMLGNTLRCGDECINYIEKCRKGTECQQSLLCFYKSSNSSWCNGPNDVICLNGTCATDARCDGRYQCSYGEDEHWCAMHLSYIDQMQYRNSKLFTRNTKVSNELRRYFSKKDEFISPSENSTSIELLYKCNRGFPFYLVDQNDIRCACPSTYYGDTCEYFTDRISVITHLDLNTLPSSLTTRLLTIVVHFCFLNTIIDHHTFHVNPLLEIDNPVRHRFYLLYSRSEIFIEHKRKRLLNRTDIIDNHPYSVRFSLFSLTENETTELGAFHYPIYFDFLPVFRLATILKFPNATLDPCINHQCNTNSICKPILNRNQSYYCACKSGYSGNNCENYHRNCSSYCHPKAICRPNSRGLIGNRDNPLCICPLGHFGPRCYLQNQACHSNPCGQNATCHASYDPSGENPVICICSEQFYGDRCQYEKSKIQFRIELATIATVSTIQFYGVLEESFALLPYQQQVIHGLPQIIRYNYEEHKIPSIVILKIYEELLNPKYFLVYALPIDQAVNITTTITPEECPYASNLLSENNNHIPAVFRYHQICKNNSSRICFYDLKYFCLCNERRALCFGQNSRIDSCDQCFAEGRCIKDNLQSTHHFICICPYCTQGDRCEFSLQAFGFTLDSLLVFDTRIVQYIYISATGIIFLLGLFNNYCSFVTFKRKQPRLVGVGNYLLFITILNQCSLLIILLKFVSIVLGSIGLTNDVSCKVISYFLSVFTRSTYWLTSWITISRLLTILYPISAAVKSPRLAIYSSVGTLIVLFLMHIHEILFYQTIQQSNSSISICVTNFHYHAIEIYNRISTLIHYLLPFIIQIVCTIYLLIRTARSRARTTTTQKTFRQVFKKQLSSQKELFITPIVIIFSALPQTILSFSLACSQLSSWQRHMLLVSILLTYIPQILGFILYVLPSTTYKKEFEQTLIAKKIFKHHS